MSILTAKLQQFWFNVLASSITLLILGFVDIITGFELSFQFFYFIPLAIFSVNVKTSRFLIYLFALITAIVWGVADVASGHSYSHPLYIYWNILSRLIIFTIFSVFLNSLFRNRAKINALVKDVSRKNESIIDSIKYARIIQDAILPDFTKFKIHNSDAFILNIPKDILSGDFFWHAYKNNKFIFGVIDCTGHGVPGSLLSMAGNSLLNKIVLENNITSPEDVLFNLNKEINTLFTAGSGNVYDGMEVAIASYDETTRELTVCQTFNGALLISQSKELLKPIISNQEIGGKFNRSGDSGFMLNKYIIETGAILFLFSDGFYDQFGGEKKKEKFYSARFNELLKEISSLPLIEQEKILTQRILKWKGDHDQIDDITVIGVRF